jgi:hypothetical protein
MSQRVKPNAGNNARLEWKGCKLRCNGVCVVELQDMTFLDRPHWNAYIDDTCAVTERKTEQSLRRAVNRRFGLPPVFGEKPPRRGGKK